MVHMCLTYALSVQSVQVQRRCCLKLSSFSQGPVHRPIFFEFFVFYSSQRNTRFLFLFMYVLVILTHVRSVMRFTCALNLSSNTVLPRFLRITDRDSYKRGVDMDLLTFSIALI